MCAIAGLVSSEINLIDVDIIKLMLSKMEHRGPDGSKLWYDDDICLGHNRLAIIDLSNNASQPMIDVSNRFIITFNGEIFNYKELFNELKEYKFKTKSDTEVLLASYIKWGNNCLSKINGQFAFAIWDTIKKELFIARDRMGEKPFYYYHNGEKFIFSSEIKPLIDLLKLNDKICKKALREYLQFQCVKAPNTLIREIKQLGPGSFGFFSGKEIRIEKYWDICKHELNSYETKEEIEKKVKSKFIDAVVSQLISDVPIGAFLSGGIDSSAIVAVMAEYSDIKPKTFSVTFDEVNFDESSYARIIAKKFKTEHNEIRVKSSDFVSKIPSILNKMDTPSGDGPNTFIVSEAVKNQGITVALSGLGGDELFAGYSGFKQSYFLNNYKQIWNKSLGLRKAISPFLKGKKNRLLNLEEFTIKNFNEINRSVFFPDEIDRLINETDSFVNLNENIDISNFPILSQYSIYDLLNYTQPILLKDSDQMSMACSLEVRVPFLDSNLIQYVLGIPDKFKFPSTSKKLFVDAIKPLLPPEIVNRPKMGFSFPWDKWIREDLYSLSYESLVNLEKRELFVKGSIIKLWTDFLLKSPNVRWSKIWLLVSLEIWLQKIEFN